MALHDVVGAAKSAISRVIEEPLASAKFSTPLTSTVGDRLVVRQDQYNLIKRAEERVMLPLCAEMGASCVPYFPQGDPS